LKERRRHKRFKVEGRVFAYYETYSPKIAEITDIGEGGASFSYTGIPEALNRPLELEMILPDSTRFMEKLPCRTVSDSEIGDGGPKTRRCSVRFEDLTENQKAKIDCFIENYCWRVSK
jgi:hypothetical protein